MSATGVLPPVPGDPAALSLGARHLSARAGTLDDAGTRLRSVRGLLADARTSAAVAASARLNEAADGVAATARLLTAAADVVTRYTRRLEALRATARVAADRHAEAEARREHWAARVAALEASVGSEALGGGGFGAVGGGLGGRLGAAGLDGLARRVLGGPSPTPLGAAGGTGLGSLGPADGAGLGSMRLEAARRARDDAAADAARSRAAWRAAHDEQRDAAARTAREIAALADTRAVRAWALADPAGTVSAFLAAREAGRQAAAAVGRLAGTSARDALVGPAAALGDDVLARLQDAGSDPVFWSAFWDAAAPAEVYAAAARVVPLAFAGEYGGPEQVGRWSALLGALAVGAAAWARCHTASEREAFGRRVAGELPSGDPGVAPGVAAALLGGADPALAPVAAGVLTGLENEHASLGRRRSDERDSLEAPLAAAALGALARDPAVALEHLAPASPNVLDARARRWFASAPHGGWPDGAVGAAAALATTVLAGATSSSRAEQARAAQLISRATAGMPHGMLASGSVIAPAAQRDVARAYHPYVGVFGQLAERVDAAGDIAGPPPEQPVLGRPGTQAPEPLADGFGAMPQVVQARLDPYLLREVVSQTSTSQEGAAAWLVDAADHQAAVLAYVFPADGSAPPASTRIRTVADFQSVARETLSDAGVIAGGLQVASVRRAELVEARRQALIDTAATVVSPGAGGLATRVLIRATPRLVDEGVKLAADAGVTTAADAVKGGFLHEVEAARHDVAVAEPRLRARFAAPAIDAAEQWSEARGATPDDAAATWKQLEPDNLESIRAFGFAYRPAADTDTGRTP